MLDKLTDKELRHDQIAANHHVQLGGVYRHKKSGAYYVPKLVALRETDLEPLVCYGRTDLPTVTFSRPLTEWLEKFEKIPPRGL